VEVEGVAVPEAEAEVDVRRVGVEEAVGGICRAARSVRRTEWPSKGV